MRGWPPFTAIDKHGASGGCRRLGVFFGARQLQHHNGVILFCQVATINGGDSDVGYRGGNENAPMNNPRYIKSNKKYITKKTYALNC